MGTSEPVLFLHLAGPATGAHLAVCNQQCARGTRDALAGAVTGPTVEPPGPPPGPVTACLRCAACGALLRPQPLGECVWHPRGCPRWHLTHTLAAAALAHRLTTRDRVRLDEVTLVQLEHTLHAVVDPMTGRPDPEEAYALLRPMLGRDDGPG